MVVLHCYVSLPEGSRYFRYFRYPESVVRRLASRTEADSAESMKFGVCKFCKMPNVNSKERERWKQIQDGDLDVKISSV